MTTFLNILFNSLETGSVYALAALGIVLIFRTSRTTNFAQGTIGTFMAFIAAFAMMKLGYNIWVVTIVALLAAFLTGVIIDTIIIRPASKAGAVSKQIITLGIIMVLTDLQTFIFGVDTQTLDRYIPSQYSMSIFGATLQYNTLLIIVVSSLLMIGLFYFIQKTRWGLATRVTAVDETTSKLMGVPTKRITMISWATAAMLGTLAAIFVAPRVTVRSDMLVSVQVSAFFAGTLGGFSTFYGPVIGAYIIALLKNVTSFYISTEWGDVIVYLIILLFLYFKPYGLFGKKPDKKV
ncbi:branched-chain amino acid ABC transporter permease [Candidatus Xianfuyuplasma coldseepsis]|uniref:Branched-chain amino acid ABC transporter permease n=1 Tax=Candidatus Xianfuyuplasma coldseepsis TaxID=2782163 RepID=A0A7L7KUN0_9MOLU|nr:branched-chain amino acid ABC transporter permease [Xianfuyuplasma coldseepsis]QMS85982.1 branched-chain amino acid ABC transporter permease [Xianfuyuplasma coldseepsis]